MSSLVLILRLFRIHTNLEPKIRSLSALLEAIAQDNYEPDHPVALLLKQGKGFEIVHVDIEDQYVEVMVGNKLQEIIDRYEHAQLEELRRKYTEVFTNFPPENKDLILRLGEATMLEQLKRSELPDPLMMLNHDYRQAKKGRSDFNDLSNYVNGMEFLTSPQPMSLADRFLSVGRTQRRVDIYEHLMEKCTDLLMRDASPERDALAQLLISILKRQEATLKGRSEMHTWLLRNQLHKTRYASQL